MNLNLNEIKEALSKATPGPWEWSKKKWTPGDGEWKDAESSVYDLSHPVGEKSYHAILDTQKNKYGQYGIYAWNEQDVQIIANAPEWLASLIEHYEELSADAIVLHRKVEEMQKTLEAAYNIACEDFESVNQMELIRLTLGESLQSLKGENQ